MVSSILYQVVLVLLLVGDEIELIEEEELFKLLLSFCLLLAVCGTVVGRRLFFLSGAQGCDHQA